MTSYTLEYTDGRVNDIVADNDREAIQFAMDLFEDGVHAEEWDQRQDGRRMLIWENEGDADDDDGSNAVAHIVSVEFGVV